MCPRQRWQVHWLEIPRAPITIRYQRCSNYCKESAVQRNLRKNASNNQQHSTYLHTVVFTNPPTNAEEANQLIDNTLATAMHATRCSVNATLQNSPGAIVFNRYIFINVPLIADLETIRNRRHALVDKNLRRQNMKRQEHTYAIRQLVYNMETDPTKMEEKLHGPYPIL